MIPVVPNARFARASVAVGLVGVSVVLGNLYGFETDPLHDGSVLLSHGWPLSYQCRFSLIWDGSQFEEGSRWLPGSAVVGDTSYVLVNILAAAIVLAATGAVAASDRFHGWVVCQFSLRELLVVMTLTAGFLALLRTTSSDWQPFFTWKPLVFLPIIGGLICTALAADRVLGWLMRRLLGFWQSPAYNERAADVPSNRSTAEEER